MNKKTNLIIKLIILFLILIFPFIILALKNYYILRIACLLGIYIILVLGLNIVIGFLGLFDLGFVAFYAIGAYSAALLSINNVSFWLCLPITIIIVVGFRLLLGLPVLRLRGDYLAIVTLGFGEITRIFLNNYDALTNGPKGLPRVGENIQRIQLFSFTFTNDMHFYYLIFFIVILSIFVIYRIENSRIGRAWVAIREDALAAEAMGINTTNMKLLGFAFSAIFPAIAGCIYTHWVEFITPELFTFWQSILLVCMVIIGGIGSIPGVIFGVFLLIGIPELLRIVLGAKFVLYRMLIFGIAMIAIVIGKPEGIIPSKRILLEFHEEKKKN